MKTKEEWNAYMRKFNAKLRLVNPEKWKLKIARDSENRRKRKMADPSIIIRNNERLRMKRKTDPEFRKRGIEDVKRNYVELRKKITEAYGSRCACCGEIEPLFLEIDHVHGGGAQHFKRAKSPITVYRQIVREGFPASYQLLCANCNKGQMRNGGKCPHKFNLHQLLKAI